MDSKIFLFIFVVLLLSCNQRSSEVPLSEGQDVVSTIAFGSCGSEEDSLLIFEQVLKHDPDMFIFLGDNIYGDTYNMDTLKLKYDKLGANPGFQRLKQQAEIIATWDDHDFGWNDAGRHYPFKSESKQIFLDFFNEPADSERRKREGIYTSYVKEVNGKKLQIILLDNRTFRDDLKPYAGEMSDDTRYFYKLDYAPYDHKDSTLLGEAQWQWLENELGKPADLRLICSGTQFGIEYNGYEAWANFPHEQKRFIDLVKKKRASGVLFLTGDVHYAEISKLQVPGMYPVYDFTSSGLSSTWHFATPNVNRIEGPVMDNHFGLLTIDWAKSIPQIKMEVWDIHNNQRVEYSMGLNEISFSVE